MSIYCEHKFIESIYSIISQSFVDDSPEKMEVAISMKNFLENSELKLDIAQNDIANLVEQHTGLFKIMKSNLNGQGKLEYLGADYPNIVTLTKNTADVELLNSVYLTIANNETIAKQRNYLGVMIVGDSDIESYKSLFGDNGIAVNKGDVNYSDWSFLKSIVPCNAMILIDNYFLKSRWKYNQNLPKILDNVIPDELESKFYLSIFTVEVSNLSNRLNRIKEIINELRPGLDYCIKLYIHDKSDFHDRYILTNYALIKSGAGFDLFKDGQARHMTDIEHIYPIFTPKLSKHKYTYKNVLEKVNLVHCNNGTTLCSESEDVINRLFHNLN